MEGDFSNVLSKYIGQKVVIIAARYQYWGVLSHVGPDCLILAKTVVVERSGPALGDAPDVKDTIGSSVILSLGACELLYLPKWVSNPLPGEDGYAN